MNPLNVYFIFGLAMALIMLWDYRNFKVTAKRLTKLSQNEGEGFAGIAIEIRNWAVMLLFAFFLWPLVLWLEFVGRDEK